jgi:hypothetical protein
MLVPFFLTCVLVSLAAWKRENLTPGAGNMPQLENFAQTTTVAMMKVAFLRRNFDRLE